MSEVKGGRAIPRIFGSLVQLDDGTTVIARNGLNARTPPNSRVGVIRVGNRWVVVERER